MCDEHAFAPAALCQAATSCPGDAKVWMALYAALAKDGKVDEARSALEKAGHLDPEVREGQEPAEQSISAWGSVGWEWMLSREQGTGEIDDRRLLTAGMDWVG